MEMRILIRRSSFGFPPLLRGRSGKRHGSLLKKDNTVQRKRKHRTEKEKERRKESKRKKEEDKRSSARSRVQRQGGRPGVKRASNNNGRMTKWRVRRSCAVFDALLLLRFPMITLLCMYGADDSVTKDFCWVLELFTVLACPLVV